ncbi:ATP-grasp fold amidoligase family protein [Lutimaribacter marinistellae]|uniref:ATP-grasp fold amidoligase family protein n=1 Tax=Lutimaribacter marinistellae TaxID=1820329 RepID=A0ABV7TCT4_9RHOB
MTEMNDVVSYNRLLGLRRWYWEQSSPRKKNSELAPEILAEMTLLREINNKERGYAYARRHGVPVVRHATFERLEDVFEEPLPQRCVIKPLAGHSSSGVYLLETQPDGSLYCHMHNRPFATSQNLIEHYRAAQRNLGPGHIVGQKVLLEEYVKDSLGYDVPLDYKVYAFKTGVAIVMQRYAPMHLHKSKWAFAFYDAGGERLGNIRLGVNKDPALELGKPDNFDEIIRVSEEFMAVTDVSFVRLDMYSSTRGVLFGEATPVPNNGKERYTPEYARVMGEMWTASLKQLGIPYVV